jgi:hypothetical protein
MNKYAQIYVTEMEKQGFRADMIPRMLKGMGEGIKMIPGLMTGTYNASRAAGDGRVMSILRGLKNMYWDTPTRELPAWLGVASRSLKGKAPARPLTGRAYDADKIRGGLAELSGANIAKGSAPILTAGGLGVGATGVAGYNALKKEPEPPPGFFEQLMSRK